MYLKSLKITSEKKGRFQNQGLTLREGGVSDLPLDKYRGSGNLRMQGEVPKKRDISK